MPTDESIMWPRKQHLKEVIRSIIVLKPKQPFVDCSCCRKDGLPLLRLNGLRQMRNYFRFVAIGLILGLYTEVLLKLVAGIKPAAFIAALFFYPMLVTISFAASRIIDRITATLWKADLLHYLATGIGGLAFEWLLLGNGPGSNAFQLGMFAMWTTFCFGPRVLIRDSLTARTRRAFWAVFGVVGILLVLLVLLAPSRETRIVLAVLSLSGAYIVWSVWLLVLARRSRQPLIAEVVMEERSGE